MVKQILLFLFLCLVFSSCQDQELTAEDTTGSQRTGQEILVTTDFYDGNTPQDGQLNSAQERTQSVAYMEEFSCNCAADDPHCVPLKIQAQPFAGSARKMVVFAKVQMLGDILKDFVYRFGNCDPMGIIAQCFADPKSAVEVTVTHTQTNKATTCNITLPDYPKSFTN